MYIYYFITFIHCIYFTQILLSNLFIQCIHTHIHFNTLTECHCEHHFIHYKTHLFCREKKGTCALSSIIGPYAEFCLIEFNRLNGKLDALMSEGAEQSALVIIIQSIADKEPDVK